MFEKRTLIIILAIFFSSFLIAACSKDKPTQFQTNDPIPEYNLLNIFDPFVALNDAINSLDSRVLNAKLAAMLDSGTDMPSFLRMAADLVRAPFITDRIIGELRELLAILLDEEPSYHPGSIGDDGFYAGNQLAPNNERYFYSGLDRILDRTELSEDVLAIMTQIVAHLNAKDEAELESDMQQLVDIIEEDAQPNDASDGTPDIKVTVEHLSELLGKLLIAADYPMWLNGGETGALRTSRSSINPASDTNTGLGNAVLGMNLLLRGLSDIARTDPQARDYLYDILREDLTALLNPANGGKNVVKQSIIDINNYFSPAGGDNDHTHVYDTNQDYRNASNPYVNASLKQTIQEILPNLALLFIRDDSASDGRPDYAAAKDASGNGRSPVESLAVALNRLKNIGIDYSQPQYRIEPSLRTLLEYNAYGQSRANPSNFQVSLLDHLVFTIAAGYQFGYLTRNSCSGEPYDNYFDESGSWGHERATGGIITVNDSMYSLTSAATFGKDSYGLALAYRLIQGPRVGRSFNYFTNSQLASKAFYLGYDFPDLLLLPSQCAGDAGIPNGGERAITPSSNATTVSAPGSVSNNDYRTYFPRVADGKGILNTAHWMMAWIARACWDGQGPYYATAGGEGPLTVTWPRTGETRGNVYKYYKPNGEEYAWVHKPDPGNAATWEYYYPATGNDVEDPDDTCTPKQRINRYKDTIRSDYYLIRRGDQSDRFCAPPMCPNCTRYVNDNGSAKYELDSEGVCTHYNWLGICESWDRHNSSYFQFYEKIREKTASRECATQEEAMYRNYQWLMLEKKFMFIIPMNIRTSVCGVTIHSAAFICIEGNGFLGVTLARKGSANGRWVLLGSEGDLPQTNGTVTNNPDYRDSSRRGDGRIIALVNPDNTNLLNPNTIFNDVLGGGYVMPDVVGKNIYPALNLALPLQDNTGNNFQNTIASNSSIIGNDASPIWQNRNMTFPLFVALAGVLMDGTKYETATSGYNYNYNGDNRYPMALALEGIIQPLAKPRARYWTDAEAFSGSPSRGRWVPRINNENKPGNFDFFYPSSQSSPPDYRPHASLKTLIGVLTEHTSGAGDGLLPLMANRTNMLSRLLALIQSLGDESRFAERENIFRGLEQVLTAVKVDASEVKSTAGRLSTINYGRHEWLFGKRDEDVNLMTYLTYDGPCEASGDPDDADWTNFDDAWDAASLFLGGSRDITPNLVNVMDAILSQDLTDQEIQGLLYTAGKIFGRYRNGSWQYHGSDHGAADGYDAVYDLLFAAGELHQFMSQPGVGRGDAGENYKLMLANLNALLQDRDSILHYIARNITTRYSSEQVVRDMNAFLSWRIVNDPQSPLWRDLALLLGAMADFEDRPFNLDLLLDYYGFQKN